MSKNQAFEGYYSSPQQHKYEAMKLRKESMDLEFVDFSELSPLVRFPAVISLPPPPPPTNSSKCTSYPHQHHFPLLELVELFWLLAQAFPTLIEIIQFYDQAIFHNNK